jgi:exosortase/archaeosortase family protein
MAAFILSCIGIYALILALPDRYTGIINEHTARALGLVLNLINIPVSVAGEIVSGKGFVLQIIPECTPVFMVGLFLCFIVFSPATVRQKASGLVLGIPALYLGNLVRLVIIFMVGQYDRSLFETVHAFWGQIYTIFLVLLCFILWLKWIDKKETQQSIPMKAAIFLARFAVIAGCLFLVWIKVHHGYIWFLDRFMIFGFSLFGWNLFIPHYAAVYYETFSVVTFISLVLAARLMPLVVKIKALAAGLGFLFLTHLFHRIDDTLITSFDFTKVLKVDMTLLVIGQYLLPMLFLIYLIRRQKQEILLKPKKSM